MKKQFISILYLILICLLFFSACKISDSNNKTSASSRDSIPGHAWWKEAIVYQIYPRSFKDSDGDGVGDLKGIISRLDYLKSLGITAVWINPIYSSPNDDNGYDISDYRNIMKEFGTMEDFDAMLKGMHERGIKLVMDLVVNHSSDEHEWFKQSRSSRTSPYRNYYHWWGAERGKPPYRYSLFDVKHDAWKYDSTTNAYYLHYFSRKQPDLNWENPKLRNEVFDIMKFWANKGIDGFRLDAFQFAAKDTTWPVLPKGFEKDFTQYYAIGPHFHDYLHEMYNSVFSKFNVMSVAEGAGRNMQDAHDMVDSGRHELNMAYAFDAIDMATPTGYSLLKFKQVFSYWDSAFTNQDWVAIFLANHDQARMVSRFGNDSTGFRQPSSKMLTTFLMTMKGTPFYYNGDELGMTNIHFKKIEDYRDVATINEYKFQQSKGSNMDDYLKKISFTSRDNGRTPFQWDGSANAGFTTGKPWLSVNPNYTYINEVAEEQDPNSVLTYFKQIVKLRKEYPVLVYGNYTLLDKANLATYAYTRELKDKKLLIVLNFTSKAAKVNLGGIDISKAKLLLCNYAVPSTVTTLQPYESLVYELN